MPVKNGWRKLTGFARVDDAAYLGRAADGIGVDAGRREVDIEEDRHTLSTVQHVDGADGGVLDDFVLDGELGLIGDGVDEVRMAKRCPAWDRRHSGRGNGRGERRSADVGVEVYKTKRTPLLVIMLAIVEL